MTPTLRFRIPRSAFGIGVVGVLCGCTPATTRPPFAPFPEARRAVIDARPARVIAEAQAWLAADSVPLRWVSVQDGYLETVWYDTVAHRAATGLTGAAAVKIRCWADPEVPGRATLTVEAVYRPLYDPSRIPRGLERPVPPGHAGAVLAARLLAALHDKFPPP